MPHRRQLVENAWIGHSSTWPRKLSSFSAKSSQLFRMKSRPYSGVAFQSHTVEVWVDQASAPQVGATGLVLCSSAEVDFGGRGTDDIA